MSCQFNPELTISILLKAGLGILVKCLINTTCKFIKFDGHILDLHQYVLFELGFSTFEICCYGR